MTENSVLLRCASCKTVNKVPVSRLTDMPRCGKCKALLDFPKSPVEVTASNFGSEVLRWPGFILVEFWSPHCGVCSSMAPVVRELAYQRAGRLKVAVINTEKEKSLSGHFMIRSVPTFILYKNGTSINELNGGLPKQELEAWIDSSLLHS